MSSSNNASNEGESSIVKRRLLNLKKELKEWEGVFEQSHGHKPTKNDINSSPADIKATYKEYHQLKAQLSYSTQNKKPKNNTSLITNTSAQTTTTAAVFGQFLNKAFQKIPKQETVGVSRPQKTRKWIKGVGYTTVLKDTSNNITKDVGESNGLTPDITPANETLPLVTEVMEIDIESLKKGVHNIRDTSIPTELPLRSVEDDNPSDAIVASIHKPRLKHGYGISGAWLDHVKPNLNTNSSETIISDTMKINHKDTRISSNSCFDWLEGRLASQEKATVIVNSSQENAFDSINQFEPSCSILSHPTEPILISTVDSSLSFEKKKLTTDTILDSLIEDNIEMETLSNKEDTETDDIATVKSLQEEVYTSDCKEEDVVQELEHENQSEPNSTSLSIVPTVNTNNNISVPIKRKSGNAVSDNFVRLNMKVKRFSRKSTRMTGAQYKRQQWKQKQKWRANKSDENTGGGQRRKGYNVCFKCGKPGHWARNCTDKGGFTNLGTFNGESVEFTDDTSGVFEEDNLLLEEIDSSCPFPSVEEATQKRSREEIKEDSNIDKTSTSMITQPLNGEKMAQSIIQQTDIPTKQMTIEPFLIVQDNNITETIPDEVLTTLRQFGHRDFKPGQKTAVLQVLSGISTLLVQPTGAGKSLCYQLPSYLYSQRSPCLTLVVSPLISLMEDQVKNLPAGLSGACLHTNLSHQQRDRILTDLRSGLINVLFISPETLVGGAYNNGWNSLMAHRLPPIAFACIDEAHCLSEWSHNFRPTYLRVHKVLKEQLGVQCLLAITATASQSTVSNIAQLLNIREEHIILGSAVPDNLVISVSCEVNREQALLDLLRSSPFNSCESIIIYCTRQQTTERVAQLLRTSLQYMSYDHSEMTSDNDIHSSNRGGKRRKITWAAECYHAGQSSAHRKKVQTDFMSGKLRIIVATVAFGMGLNKADVRAVIHYNMPKSFESFVQEIGRAGRDGEPAYCHTFIDDKVKQLAKFEGTDPLELRRHIYSNSVDYFSVKQLIQHIFSSCSCTTIETNNQTNTEDKGCSGHEVAISINSLVHSLDLKEETLATMLCYLEFQGWIEVLNPINDTCCLKCYGGPGQLKALAKRVPAVNVGVNIERKKGTYTDQSNSVSFSLTQAANTLQCDSLVVYQVLRDLQYNDYNTSSSGHTSTVTVEFNNMSFHLTTRGDISNDEKDMITEQLLKKVKEREARDVERLYRLYSILKHASQTSYKDEGQDNPSLKQLLQLYFLDKLDSDYLRSLGITHCYQSDQSLTERQMYHIRHDIQALLSCYDDHQFTGRTIARILQGISSPCYPAEVWGKCRQFWRKHLNVDFNILSSIATEELIKFNRK